MKYIDEKRLRIAYVVLLSVAAMLLIGAILDIAYNSHRGLNWYISGTVAVFVLALMYFVSTELLLREALDLRPQAEVTNPDPITIDMPAMEVPMSTTTAQTETRWQDSPMRGPSFAGRIDSRKDPARSALVEALGPSAAPGRPERPDGIPRPSTVRPAPHAVTKETLTLELGNPQFRVASGIRGRPTPGTVLEPARILCGQCGLYFNVILDHARPAAVPCPRCDASLGLSGATQRAEHVSLRCRHCGDFVQVPAVAGHKASQCATCGQINN